MPISLIELLPDKELLVGVIDVASNQVETPEQGRRDHRRGVEACRCRAHPALHQLRHGAAFAATVAVGKLQALGAGAALARKRQAAPHVRQAA